MANEITGLGSPKLTGLGEESTAKKVGHPDQQTKGGDNTSGQYTDVVTITPSAVKLQAVEQQLASIPVVDQNRVNQLRLAIEAGEYKFDAKRTADKFVQFETALTR